MAATRRPKDRPKTAAWWFGVLQNKGIAGTECIAASSNVEYWSWASTPSQLHRLKLKRSSLKSRAPVARAARESARGVSVHSKLPLSAL